MSKEIETEDAKNNKNTHKYTIYAILGAVIISAGAFVLYQNRDYIQSVTKNDVNVADTVVENNIQQHDNEEIFALQKQMEVLQNSFRNLAQQDTRREDVTQLNERINELSAKIDSLAQIKANAQNVLDVISRIDRIESDVYRLSHINNEGAIALATVAMIKEHILFNQNFEFEAMMLSELLVDNPNLSADVQIIKDASQKAVLNDKMLEEEFEKIYKNILHLKQKQASDQSWQDRINSKISNLISIEKKDKNVAQQNGEAKFMTQLHDLVKQHKFMQVVVALNENDSDLKNNELIKSWILQVFEKQKLDDAINNLTTYSLVLMRLDKVVVKD